MRKGLHDKLHDVHVCHLRTSCPDIHVYVQQVPTRHCQDCRTCRTGSGTAPVEMHSSLETSPSRYVVRCPCVKLTAFDADSVLDCISSFLTFAATSRRAGRHAVHSLALASRHAVNSLTLASRHAVNSLTFASRHAVNSLTLASRHAVNLLALAISHAVKSTR